MELGSVMMQGLTWLIGLGRVKQLELTRGLGKVLGKAWELMLGLERVVTVSLW